MIPGMVIYKPKLLPCTPTYQKLNKFICEYSLGMKFGKSVQKSQGKVTAIDLFQMANKIEMTSFYHIQSSLRALSLFPLKSRLLSQLI